MSRLSHRRVVYISCVLGISLFLTGVFAGASYENSKFIEFFSKIHPLRNTVPGYEYTAPFLGTDSPPATDIGLYTDLRSRIVDAANTAKRDGDLIDYGVYFKSLNSPFWFGVNEDKNFLPASLYKIPIALVVYKEIESGALNPRDTLTYTRKIQEENPPGAMQTSLSVGTGYTITDLVGHMLEQSDNGAKNLLGQTLRPEYVNTLWSLMNLGSPHPDEEISARDYSFFFRVLYNSTYLNSDDSEKVLGMLASSTYTYALVSGIPENIHISHKWGLSNLADVGRGPETEIELHDCGIVYATNNPYILCVMTTGHEQQALNSFIARISGIVFANNAAL